MTLMPGRFRLGVGSGEALNEHVFGAPWPHADGRLEMLEEAVEVIRLMWQGGLRDVTLGDKLGGLLEVARRLDAGFDEIDIGQIGPDHDGFVDFYAREILPCFTRGRAAATQSPGSEVRLKRARGIAATDPRSRGQRAYRETLWRLTTRATTRCSLAISACSAATAAKRIRSPVTDGQA